MNGPIDDFDAVLDVFFERLREGTAGVKDVSAMEEQLRASSEFRKRYRARVRMEEELAASFSQPSNLVLPFEKETPRPWSRMAATWWLAAAAVVALVVTLGIASHDHSPATVATLEMGNHASWLVPPVLIADSKVAPGKVTLESGIAHFRFHSGALVILEGPASLVIESAMRAELLHGQVLVETPESAQGFAIAHPHGETMDLGTRFSLSVDGDVTTCEVLEGRVVVRHALSGEEKHLEDGQAMEMNQAGIIALSYRPSMGFSPRAANSRVLRTKAEATVISSNNREARLLDDRMLLVKSEPGSNVQRRALFNIDLGGIRPEQITAARINLNLVPSGLGFASSLPDLVTFAVYGITDPSREGWPAENPLWENMPGYVQGDDHAVNPSDTTPLGKFTIERGQQRGVIKLESDELLAFLRADTTGTAGFLVIRETGGVDNYSLVHAFASSLHPEASGPSLEVMLEN